MHSKSADLKYNWTKRHNKKIFIIRATLTLVNSLFVTSLFALSAHIFLPHKSGAASIWISSIILSPLRLPTDADTRLAFLFIRAPFLVLFASTFCIIWLKRTKKSAEFITNTFFAEFDWAILTPVSKRLADEPSTLSSLGAPWISPGPGTPRAKAWYDLEEFVHAESGDGSAPLFWWAHPTRFENFGYTLLLGRSGQGKSRMALELGRAISRRDVLSSNNRQVSNTYRLKLRLKSWLRIIWGPAKRSRFDPWDAGWLDFRGKGESLLAALATWAPRRPTVLLLDDPPPGCASLYIGVLQNASLQWKHPVRLIIINPSAPSGLISNKSGTWKERADQLGPLRQPVILGGDTNFNEGECIALAQQIMGLDNKALWRASDRREFSSMTSGSPLLIELGAAWVGDGNSIADMSPAILLDDRASRIVNSIYAAGLAEGDLHHLACSTLSGGIDLSISDWELESNFGPISNIASFRRLFPEIGSDLENWLPPITPQLIGDAFVRHVIGSSVSPNFTAQKLFSSAWRISPLGTLNSTIRLARNKNFPPQDRDLQAADNAILLELRKVPQATGIAKLELSTALLDAAIQTLRADWDGGDRIDKSEIMEQATRILVDLSENDAIKILESMINFLSVDSIVAVCRGEFAIIALDILSDKLQTTSTPELVGEYVEKIFDLAFRWSVGSPLIHSSTGTARVVQLIKALAPSSPRVVDLFPRTLSLSPNLAFAACLAASESVSDEFAKARLLNYGLIRSQDAGLNPTSLGNPTSAQQAADLVYATIGWFSNGTAISRASISHLEQQVHPFLVDETATALARLYAEMAFLSLSKNQSNLQKIFEFQESVNKIENLINIFPQNDYLKTFKSAAYTVHARYWQQKDYDECRLSTEIVEKIRTESAPSSERACQAAEAWQLLVGVYANSVPISSENLEYAMEHLLHAAETFQGCRLIELFKISAWRMYVGANRTNLPLLNKATAEAGLIHNHFYYDAQFIIEFAQVLIFGMETHSGNLITCRKLLRQIEDISSQDLEKLEILEQIAIARGKYAFSARHQKRSCEAAVQDVKEICVPLSGNRIFDLVLARALRVFAWSLSFSGEDSESTIGYIKTISEKYPNEKEFQYELAHAWRSLTGTLSNQHVRCKLVVAKVDDIAMLFKGTQEFDIERARARLGLMDVRNLPDQERNDVFAEISKICAAYPRDDEFIRSLALARARLHSKHEPEI